MKTITNGQPNEQPTVVRTGRGLSVAGTRITLYAIMDFIKEDYPPKLIRHKFNLTEQQMTDVLAYIDEHREQVEAEYQQVVAEGEERRRYHEEKLREHLASRPPRLSVTPEEVAIRAKLSAEKPQPGADNLENATNGQAPATIIRTGRGLTIAGTRTTLYRIMDYVKADWPPKLIRNRLNLTDQQVAAALAYIEQHHTEVETEYQQVLAEAEEMKRESEEKRRAVQVAIAAQPTKPEEAVIRAKLAAAKARLGME